MGPDNIEINIYTCSKCTKEKKNHIDLIEDVTSEPSYISELLESWRRDSYPCNTLGIARGTIPKFSAIDLI